MKLSSTPQHDFVHCKKTSNKRLKQSKKAVQWPQQDFVKLKQKMPWWERKWKKGDRRQKCEISSDRYEVWSCINIGWDHSIWSLVCECTLTARRKVKKGENSQSGTCIPGGFTLVANKQTCKFSRTARNAFREQSLGENAALGHVGASPWLHMVLRRLCWL